MVPELSKKQRKALVILSVTGGVYISFKYFLPLILPFAAAYLAALVLRPGAAWIEKRLQINIRGRRYSVPIGVIGGAELLLLATAAGLLLFCGSRRLMEEANEMIHAVPGWMMRLDQWLTSLCRTAEGFCRLREGALGQAAREMITAMTRTLRQAAMSSLAVNSVAALSFCARAFVMAAVFFMAAVLSLQEMDEMKRRRRQSMFSREFALFGRRLIMTGSAWLRTQLVIMLVTACLCALGLLLIRNPYSILLGAVIGVLDALPLFGAGAVLIPWSVVAMAQGHFYQGGVLALLFLICCLTREFLEARLMGGKMGLSPLETLTAIYVGMKLFGILGMLLGPIGLLIIEDLVEEYGEKRADAQKEDER